MKEMVLTHVHVTGRLNVKQKEIDEMLKEALGPVNFTMFGEKLKGEVCKQGMCSVVKTSYYILQQY